MKSILGNRKLVSFGAKNLLPNIPLLQTLIFMENLTVKNKTIPGVIAEITSILKMI